MTQVTEVNMCWPISEKNTLTKQHRNWNLLICLTWKKKTLLLKSMTSPYIDPSSILIGQPLLEKKHRQV